MTDRRVSDLSNREVCELVAQRLQITSRSGTVTVELVFKNGAFVRAHTHTGPIGAEALESLREENAA